MKKLSEATTDRLARAVVDQLREPGRRRGLVHFDKLSDGLREEWMKEGRAVVGAVLRELWLCREQAA